MLEQDLLCVMRVSLAVSLRQSEVTWDQDPTSQSEVTRDGDLCVEEDGDLCVEDAALAEKSVELVGVDEFPLGESHDSLGGRDVLEVHAEGVGEVNQGVTFISQN